MINIMTKVKIDNINSAIKSFLKISIDKPYLSALLPNVTIIAIGNQKVRRSSSFKSSFFLIVLTHHL